MEVLGMKCERPSNHLWMQLERPTSTHNLGCMYCGALTIGTLNRQALAEAGSPTLSI